MSPACCSHGRRDANAKSRSATSGQGRQRLRAMLVVGELALSVVLLIGAGLALRSFVRLQHVDPGFDVDDQLTFTLVMPPARYAAAADQIAFVRRALEEFTAAPGVQHAGATTQLPFSGQNMENSFMVEGLDVTQGAEKPVAGMRGVTADTFGWIGVS